MKKGFAFYAAAVYAFLYLPLLILAVFSVNASRFTVWQGFSARWYQAMLADRDLLESTANSLIIATASTLLATAIGTLAAYALWKRSSVWLSGSLYLSLVTPEIVTGVSLLAFYQWVFRYLHLQLGMHTVVLAHLSFSVAYVVLVVLARLRTFDPALEEAALDLGATELGAFRRVTLPYLAPPFCRGGHARLHGVDRRLRDHQPGRGSRFADAAHGDLCHGAARREPGVERGVDGGGGGAGRAGADFGKAARAMSGYRLLTCAAQQRRFDTEPRPSGSGAST